MPLAPGARLGPFEIVGPIGAGGMGEVYKARDTRLDRTVAIKVLPALFASDATFRARFEREAKAISALNHQHICTLYDFGNDNGTTYLVMEYVDGIPLHGPMPVPRAVALAIQICDALDAAHRAGIVHRDLKPSNILVTEKTDVVKLLDFGLAIRPAQASGSTASSIGATMTGPLTAPHTVVGTPQYMAPEQIEGRESDTRTDIFALGCVLYEMLTGARAFEGKSPSAVMGAILATEPRPIRELQPVTPPDLEWIVSQCLAKDPDERWQSVRDLRAALERVLEEPAVAVPAVPQKPSRLPWLVAALASLAAIVAITVASRIWTAEPVADTRVFKSQFIPPTSPTGAPALRLALSPDGTRLAYVAPDQDGRVLIWVRPLDSLVAQPLTGTLNASAPFWSPDSRFIAFLAEGRLKKVEASGGPVVTLCEAMLSPPGSWSRDGVIVFTGANSNLVRVPAVGGTPVAVTSLSEAEGERNHIAPFFLPDGHHFLFTSAEAGSRVRAIKIGSLDSAETTTLPVNSTSNAMYASGNVIFMRDTTLMAQAFDPSSLTLSGDARPIDEKLQVNPTTGTGAFTVSQTGVLAYQASTGAGGTSLAWMDRKGIRTATLGERGGYLDVQLAPDERRASVTLIADDSRSSDIWVFDVARNLRTRFTFGPDSAMAGLWSPDGSRLVYVVRHAKANALVIKSSSGAGREQVVISDAVDRFPLSWSPDGKFLLFSALTGGLTGKLHILSMEGEPSPHPFLGTTFSEIPAVISPDGHWVAYVSNESGRREVYVTTFPEPAGKWQVSAVGGDFPRWRADGKELFFLSAERMMAAAVDVRGKEFEVGTITPLFSLRWPVGTRSPYDVSRDGQRFLTNVWDVDPGTTPITVVVNWHRGR